MDCWRTFFGKAGADLWTIIEQALILAATDHPDEFKAKRCDIAEVLFSRRPRQLISGDTDATRLSGSFVTNDTNRLEGKERGDDEYGTHTQRPCRDDRSDYDEAEALNDELEEETLVMEEVNSIKATLMDSEQSEIVILDSLQTLVRLPITVDALKATEIGKQVNNLRKHSSKAIRSLVRQLVSSWKEVVDEWVKSVGGVPAIGGSAPGGCVSSEGHEKEQGSISPLYDESILFSAGRTHTGRSQFPYHMDNEMRYGDIYCQEENHLDPHLLSISPQADYCDHDLKASASHNDWEAPEEMGSSSRVELTGLGKVQIMEKKPQLNGRGFSSQIVENQRDMHHFGVLSISKSSKAGSGPGRPVTDVSKVKEIGLSGNFDLTKIVNEVSKAKKNYGLQGDCSQKNRESKIPTGIHNSTTLGEVQAAERLEIAKRKLYEGYRQAENVKKHQTVSRLELPDLPKGGPIRAKVASAGQSIVASSSWHRNQSRR